MKILLIDLYRSDALLDGAFAGNRAERPVILLARSEGEALLRIKDEAPDLIVVSLDETETAIVERVHKVAPQIPVLALGGREDDEATRELIRLGAEDHLAGAEVTPRLIRRAILAAFERSRLRGQVEAAQTHVGELQRDLDEYRRLYAFAVPSVVAESFGQRPLKDQAPAKFQELLDDYTVALDTAVAATVHKGTDAGRASQVLVRMGDDLGFLQAGARDVVDLHTQVVRRKLRTVATGSSIYLEEGRVLLVELMGNLLSFYRKYALPAVRESKRDDA